MTRTMLWARALSGLPCEPPVSPPCSPTSPETEKTNSMTEARQPKDLGAGSIRPISKRARERKRHPSRNLFPLLERRLRCFCRRALPSASWSRRGRLIDTASSTFTKRGERAGVSGCLACVCGVDQHDPDAVDELCVRCKCWDLPLPCACLFVCQRATPSGTSSGSIASSTGIID